MMRDIGFTYENPFLLLKMNEQRYYILPEIDISIAHTHTTKKKPFNNGNGIRLFKNPEIYKHSKYSYHKTLLI